MNGNGCFSIAEAWYPTAAAIASDPSAQRMRFGDFFANDPKLWVHTEQNLLERSGWSAEVIAEKIQLDAPDLVSVFTV